MGDYTHLTKRELTAAIRYTQKNIPAYQKAKMPSHAEQLRINLRALKDELRRR